jgi:hypothetical protein
MLTQSMHSLLLVAAFLAATNSSAQQAFQLDPSFQVGISSSYVASIQIMNNSNILVTGLTNFTSNDLNDYYGSIQLFEDGSRNATFPAFPLTTGNGELKKWNDKYYVIAGQEVSRLLSNGYVDADFGPMFEDEFFSSLQAGDFHIFNDGRILFSGQHLLDDTVRDFEGIYTLVWFSNEGYLDTTRIHRQSNGRMFEFEAYPEGSVPEVEGKFLCSTQGTQYEGQAVGKVFRIHPDGALDTTYQSPLSNFGWVQVIHPFPDGSALLGGAMKLVGGTDTLSLLKLLPDGSLDLEFQLLDYRINTFFASLTSVNDVHVLNDGRMIVVGNFEFVNEHEHGCIAMLESNGTLLTDQFEGAFCGDYENSPIVNNRYLKGITPAPDGSYYIYGAYHGYHDGATYYPQQRFISRLYGLDVGIAERRALPPLQPYPNPAGGTFTLELPLKAPAPLELLDAIGRVVHTQLLRPGTHSHTVQSALPAGVYLLRVQEAQGVRRGRVVVE